MEKKFDVLLNSKCSWSYRSKKVLGNKTANGVVNDGNSSVQIQKTVTTIHISKQDNSFNANNITKSFPSINVSKSKNADWLDTENRLEKNSDFETSLPETKINNLLNRCPASSPRGKKPVRKQRITKEMKNSEKTNRILRNEMPKNYKETESFSSSSEDEVLQTRLSVKNTNEFKTKDLEENTAPNSDTSHVSILSDAFCESVETDAVSTKEIQITSNSENVEDSYKILKEDNSKETKHIQNGNIINSPKQDFTDILQINEYMKADSMSVEVSSSSYNQECTGEGILSVSNSPEDTIPNSCGSYNNEKHCIENYNEDQMQEEIVGRCLDFSKEIQSICSELEMSKTFPEDTITDDFFNGKFDVVKYKLQGTGEAEKSFQTSLCNKLKEHSKTSEKNNSGFFSNSPQPLKNTKAQNILEYIKSTKDGISETDEVCQEDQNKRFGKNYIENANSSTDKEMKYEEKGRKNRRKTTELQKKSLTHKVPRSISKKILEGIEKTPDQNTKDKEETEGTFNNLKFFSFLGTDETELHTNKDCNLKKKKNNAKNQENKFTAWDYTDEISKYNEEGDDVTYSVESEEVFPQCIRNSSHRSEKRKNVSIKMQEAQKDGLQQLKELKVPDHVNKEESFKHLLETVTEGTEMGCINQNAVTNRNDKNEAITRKQPTNKCNTLDIHSVKYPYQKISSTYTELPKTNNHSTHHYLEEITTSKHKSSNKMTSIARKSIANKKSSPNTIKKQKISMDLLHNFEEESEQEFHYEDKIMCKKRKKTLLGKNNANTSLLQNAGNICKTNKNLGIQSNKDDLSISKREEMHNSNYSKNIQTNTNNYQDNETEWFSENSTENFSSEILNLKSLANTNFVGNTGTGKLQQTQLHFNYTPEMWEDLENELLSNDISNTSHNSPFLAITNDISKDFSEEAQVTGRSKKFQNSLDTPKMQKSLNKIFNNLNKNHINETRQLTHSKSYDSNLNSIQNAYLNVSKPAVHSPSISIVDKTIAAMEKCTSEYISSSVKFQQQNDPLKNLEEYDSESIIFMSNSESSTEELQSTISFTKEKFYLNEITGFIQNPVRNGNKCKNTESKRTVYETKKKLHSKFKTRCNKNETSKGIEFSRGDNYKSDIFIQSNPHNISTRLKLNKSATVTSNTLQGRKEKKVHKNIKTSVQGTWDSLIQDLNIEDTGKVISNTNDDINQSIKNDSNSENEMFSLKNYLQLGDENSIHTYSKSPEKYVSYKINEHFSDQLNISSLKWNESKKHVKKPEKYDLKDDLNDSFQNDSHSEYEMFLLEEEQCSGNDSVKVTGGIFNNQCNNPNLKPYNTRKRKNQSNVQYKTTSIMKKENGSKKQIENINQHILMYENLNQSTKNDSNSENEMLPFKNHQQLGDDNSIKTYSKSHEKSISNEINEHFSEQLNISSLKCNERKKHVKKPEKCDLQDVNVSLRSDSHSEYETFPLVEEQYSGNDDSVKVTGGISNNKCNNSNLKHYSTRKSQSNLPYKTTSIMKKENGSKKPIQNINEHSLTDEYLYNSFRNEGCSENETSLEKGDQNSGNGADLIKHNSVSPEEVDLSKITEKCLNQPKNSNLKRHKTRKRLSDDNLQNKTSKILKNEPTNTEHIKIAQNKQVIKLATPDEKAGLDIRNKEEITPEIQNFSTQLQDNHSMLLQNEELPKQLKENMLDEFSCTSVTRIRKKTRNLGSKLLTNQSIKNKAQQQIILPKEKNYNDENKNSDTNEHKMLVENSPMLTKEKITNSSGARNISHLKDGPGENVTLALSNKNSLVTNDSNEGTENSRAQNTTNTGNDENKLPIKDKQKQRNAKEKYVKYLNKHFEKLDIISEKEQSQKSSAIDLPGKCKGSERNEIPSYIKDKWKNNLIARNEDDLFSLSSSDSDDSSITSLKKFKGSGLLCEFFED